MTDVYQTRLIDINLWQDVGLEPEDVLSRSLTFKTLESAKKSLEDEAREFEAEMIEDLDDNDEPHPEQSTFEWKETSEKIEWRCEPSNFEWILMVAKTELQD